MSSLAILTVLLLTACSGGTEQTGAALPPGLSSAAAEGVAVPTFAITATAPVLNDPSLAPSPPSGTSEVGSTATTASRPRTSAPPSTTPSSAGTSTRRTTPSWDGASRSTTPPDLKTVEDCLLAVADVENVLEGAWEVEPSPDKDFCTYTADRGSVFIAIMIPAPAAELDRELRSARSACTGPVEDIGGNPVAFMCPETTDGTTLISGSVVSHGRLWLVSLPVIDEQGDHADELAALAVLLGAALQYQ